MERKLTKALPFVERLPSGNSYILIWYALQVAKKEQVRVRRGGQEARYHVFLFGIKVNNADAAALLLFVLVGVGALYVAVGGHHQHLLVVGHQIFDIDNAGGALDYFGCALVAVLFGNGLNFLFYNTEHLFVRI